MPKMAVVSLGCSKNLVDTEIMLGRLVKHNWELTSDFSEAELILVNTCGFIESAKTESIHHILEMATYKEPGRGNCRILVVAGCLVQRYLQDLKAEIPEVDYWIGLNQLDRIAAIVSGEPAESSEEAPFLNNENLERYRVTLTHTAFLKIAEGCSHRCAYCAIPVIKGGYRSRNPEAIIAEAAQLVQGGVKELNIIAQDITMYGRDLSRGLNLRILLERILEEARPDWIRLLYAYPSGLDEALLRLIQSTPNICKYLDLPFQHINERILRLMNRRENRELLLERLQMIRAMVPEMVLRTTFIVGFPTETDAEFEELRQFVAEGHFEHAGVFSYSREEQTPAYDLKPQIEPEVKEERRRILLETQQKVSARLLKRFVGREERILIDRVFDDGRAIGRTEAFAPEVDGVVSVEGYHGPTGVFINRPITGNDAYNLFSKK